jgi:hypothetical protein
VDDATPSSNSIVVPEEYAVNMELGGVKVVVYGKVAAPLTHLKLDIFTGTGLLINK